MLKLPDKILQSSIHGSIWDEWKRELVPGEALRCDDKLAAANRTSDVFMPTTACLVGFGEEPAENADGVECVAAFERMEDVGACHCLVTSVSVDR